MSENGETLLKDDSEAIQANVEARKAFGEMLDIINEAIGSVDHPNFRTRLWEHLREASIQEVGLPPKHEDTLAPLEDKIAKNLLGEEMPFGKYVGEKIEDVLQKDKEYLVSMSTRPLWIQILVRKLLIWDTVQKEKQAKKEAAVKAKEEKEAAKKKKEQLAEGENGST